MYRVQERERFARNNAIDSKCCMKSIEDRSTIVIHAKQ